LAGGGSRNKWHTQTRLKGMAVTEKTQQGKSQAKTFLQGEGDHYFERSKAVDYNGNSLYANAIIKRVLTSFKNDIGSILEIGCSDGTKLRDLCDYFVATGYGIDPSASAIRAGREAHGDLQLSIGISSHLPYEDNKFDLVFFGFCLYLVDRNEIFKTVSEADRVLKSGGFIAIFDFDPTHRQKRSYHHVPGLFSYKSHYADFFVSGGHYYLVAKESFSARSCHFTTNSDERVSISVLYKEPDPY
jgi:ubiquinone/menaquinone biosynthesis C-methylase UbiE